MNITQTGVFWIGNLQNTALPEADRQALLALTNEETADELLELVAQAEALAAPRVLFGVPAVDHTGNGSFRINGTDAGSPLVVDKLKDADRCFPFVATCGVELEAWSARFRGDPLEEFWADEIKKRYLQRITSEFFRHLKEHYQAAGHLTALNPGSLKDWPISGQRELFEILGGREFVREQTGVSYTDSFLMLPSKSLSGIAFESAVFYENCQHCPLADCPNRRAAAK